MSMATPPPYRHSGQVTPPGYLPAPPGDYYFRSPPPENPPGAKKRRWIWWLIGGIVALLLIGGLVISLIVFAARNIGPARDVTTGYFVALKAHDWAAADDYLSASLRATVKPADLQATWTRREQADGTIDRFAITNSNVTATNGKTTATIGGTLSFTGGVSDPKIITLVKEDGNWKLSRLP